MYNITQWGEQVYQVAERKVGFDPQLLRRLREAKKPFLSQQALGEAIGVKQKVVSAWETGAKNPNYEHLAALADFFETTTDYFLGVTNDPRKPSQSRENPELIDKLADALAKEDVGEAAEIFARLVKGEK